MEKFSVEQLKLIGISLLDREDKIKELLENKYISETTRDRLVREFEIGEETREKIYQRISEENFIRKVVK